MANNRQGFLAIAAMALALCGPAQAQSRQPTNVSLVPPDGVAAMMADPAAAARDHPVDPRPALELAKREAAAGRLDAAVAEGRRAEALAQGLGSIVPDAVMTTRMRYVTARTLSSLLQTQGDWTAALAAESRAATAEPTLPAPHGDEMRIALTLGDVPRAERAAEERARLAATVPRSVPERERLPPPYTWSLPARVSMAAGKPAEALSRLATNGPDGPPPTDVDRADALVVEGLATLAGGRGAPDDASALADLAKPFSLVPDDPRYRAWDAVSALLSGKAPDRPALTARVGQVAWPMPLVPYLAGDGDPDTLRQGLEKAWSARLAAAAKAKPGPARDDEARDVAAQRCDADFFIAIRRGHDGKKDWVDDIAALPTRCAAGSETTWAAAAIAGRWGAGPKPVSK